MTTVLDIIGHTLTLAVIAYATWTALDAIGWLIARRVHRLRKTGRSPPESLRVSSAHRARKVAKKLSGGCA